MKSIRITALLCSLALLLQTGIVFAQNASAQKKDSPIITEDANPRLKSPVTMRAQDASLAEVLKVLSDRSGMNFVTGEGVYKEKITIILNNTPVDEAIDLVVRAAGLSYEIIGNSVLIAEPDKLNRGEVGQQGYVIKLKYAEATEVASMLGDLTKFVKVDKGGNRLVCFTSPRIINEIERIVKSIDHPHILVSLETRLIEVSVDNLKNYGVRWGNLSPSSFGIMHPEVALTTGYNINGWILNPLDFSTSLDILVQNGKAKVLMDSRLTTTNNREAKLQIGTVVPYLIQSYNLSGSGGINQQVQKEETGVKIVMTPHVNESNQITINVEPEVSNIIDWKGPNKDMPMTKVRKTSTTVRVEDGQTVFLAGLLSEEKSTTINKLPILGDIPLLGLLFQNKREELIKSNLILEITPRILLDSAEIAGVAAKESASSTNASSEASTSTVTVPATAQPAAAPAASQPQSTPAAQQPAPVAPASQPAATAKPAAVQPQQPAAPAAAQPATTPAAKPAPATPAQQPAAPASDQQKKESR